MIRIVIDVNLHPDHHLIDTEGRLQLQALAAGQPATANRLKRTVHTSQTAFLAASAASARDKAAPRPAAAARCRSSSASAASLLRRSSSSRSRRLPRLSPSAPPLRPSASASPSASAFSSTAHKYQCTSVQKPETLKCVAVRLLFDDKMHMILSRKGPRHYHTHSLSRSRHVCRDNTVYMLGAIQTVILRSGCVQGNVHSSCCPMISRSCMRNLFSLHYITPSLKRRIL